MTVTVNCSKNEVVVRLDLTHDEYLLYYIEVTGAKGIFALLDNKNRLIFSQEDWPSPQKIYQRKWPQKPAEVPPENDFTQAMGFHFITTLKYIYKVTRHASDGTPLEVLKDCVYESNDPRDSYFESLRIFRV